MLHIRAFLEVGLHEILMGLTKCIRIVLCACFVLDYPSLQVYEIALAAKTFGIVTLRLVVTDGCKALLLH